jgi:hypothetical protein
VDRIMRHMFDVDKPDLSGPAQLLGVIAALKR